MARRRQRERASDEREPVTPPPRNRPANWTSNNNKRRAPTGWQRRRPPRRRTRTRTRQRRRQRRRTTDSSGTRSSVRSSVVRVPSSRAVCGLRSRDFRCADQRCLRRCVRECVGRVKRVVLCRRVSVVRPRRRRRFVLFGCFVPWAPVENRPSVIVRPRVFLFANGADTTGSAVFPVKTSSGPAGRQPTIGRRYVPTRFQYGDSVL